MSGILIGVGGSGQHVAHAYLSMMVLGNVPATEVPHIYIVDADADIKDERDGTANLSKNIFMLHKQLISTLPHEQRPTFGIIRPYFQHSIEDRNPGTALQHIDGDDRDILINCFLTDDISTNGTLDANDRTVDINQGMMANAKVGAFIFKHKLELCKENKEANNTNFGTLMSCIPGQRIAIVGSSFGGTGSGVIPSFVRHLDALTVESPDSIRAFMMLPWFDIKPKSGRTGRPSSATTSDGIDPQARNSALGLRNYLNELASESLNRSNYVIAQYTGEIAIREDHGNFGQPETPHVFNSVFATSIRHYLVGDNLAPNVGKSRQRVIFGLHSHDSNEKIGVFDPKVSHHLRFRIDNDDNRQLYDLMLDTEVAALALEKGAEYIRSGFKVAQATKQVEPEGLAELCLHIGINDSNKVVKRGFFGFGRDVGSPEVYLALAEELSKIANRMRSCLVWLDSQKSTSGIPGLQIEEALLHLFDTTSEGKFRILTESELDNRWKAYELDVNRRNGGDSVSLKNSPKTSQAFGLFINCFEGRHIASQLVDMAKKNKGVSLYVLAADVLVSAAYTEAGLARKMKTDAQHKTNIGDERKDNVGKCFLKANIPGIFPGNNLNANSRVAQLDKTALDTTTAEVSDNDVVYDPMLPTHPVSLSQIDPLLGTADIAALNKLRKGVVGFKENCLKGIPNLLAPILLQHWRLRQFSNHPQMESFALWTIQPGQPIRSTRWGMYYFARSVIEAAL